MDTRADLRRAQSLADPAERVAALTRLLAEVEDARHDVQAARDQAVRDMRASGAPISQIQTILGVTRGRVHQIIGGRRK